MPNVLASLAVKVGAYQRKYPEWREGQTWFNVLYEQHPEIADDIRGTILDPFYNDENLPRFFNFLTKQEF